MDAILSAFSFPVRDPVWIFFLVMMIILFAPIIFNRLKIPHIIGMILAGILLGEHGFNVLERDSSFELFGQVGLFYIMFLAGMEMDLEDFRKNKVKGLVFGFLTFLLPMVLGVWSSMALLDFGWTTSILLASMYASHTLLAYPIVSRYGLSRERSVTVTIGGTAVTVTLALGILAVIAGMYQGTADGWYWAVLVMKVIVLGLLIIYGLPQLARRFFRKFDDPVLHFVFVLAMVFLGGGLMALAGMEGILGAFLVGMVLNPLVPRVSPLMNRLEFVGNALFIPYFLIGVGMIIDVRTLFAGGMALKVAVVMTVVATASKWIAAFLTQKIYRMSRIERGLMFGLSNAQAVATLAAVLVGHEIILENGERLLNDDVLNGTVVMILFTCIISSLVTEYFCRRAALSAASGEVREGWSETRKERILIPVANPDTIESLVNLALMVRGEGSKGELVALSVTTDSSSVQNGMTQGRKLLEQAARIAAAADVPVQMVSRYDLTVPSGIIHTIKEYEATGLVIGLHRKSGFMDTFFGSLTNNLLKGTCREVLVSRFTVPVNTLKGIVALVPPRAEYETGFARWIHHLCRLAGQLDCKVLFRAEPATAEHLEAVCREAPSGTLARIEPIEGNLSFAERMEMQTGRDDLFAVVCARPDTISYDSCFERLPSLLNRFYAEKSILIVYPEQIDRPESSFSSPMA